MTLFCFFPSSAAPLSFLGQTSGGKCALRCCGQVLSEFRPFFVYVITSFSIFCYSDYFFPPFFLRFSSASAERKDSLFQFSVLPLWTFFPFYSIFFFIHSSIHSLGLFLFFLSLSLHFYFYPSAFYRGTKCEGRSIASFKTDTNDRPIWNLTNPLIKIHGKI